MKPITVTTTIDRPRAEVYAHLDVLANHEAFTDHFMVDWELSGPPAGVGAALRANVKALGQKQPIALEVYEAKAPELIVERTVAAGGKRVTRGTYRLEEAGPDATKVSFEIAYEETPLGDKLAAPMIRSVLRKMNQRAMDRLTEQLSAGGPQPAG
ncbi:MAG: SRPBCC family protein [Solirubrobacteraceae bacterium]|nr:SRPBCC family protein [Solirubrobacteraceae bacterium]